MTIAAIVIAKNEERSIQRCLRTLAFVDEIIVVVDRSSLDNTALLAQEAGATVLFEDWQGYGHQKNKGAAAAKSDWLLFVDADEEVSRSLATEIRQTVSQSQYNVYWLKIITLFLGTPLRHLYGHNPRLFRRGTARWTDSYVHEQAERLAAKSREVPPMAGRSGISTPLAGIIRLGDRDTGVLKTPLLHNSHSTVKDYLQKMHRYTTLDAEQMRRTQQHRSGRPIQVSLFLPPILAVRQWIKLLLYRKGFLDGWAGFVWCTLSAYYEWEMARKFLEIEKSESRK